RGRNSLSRGLAGFRIRDSRLGMKDSGLEIRDQGLGIRLFDVIVCGAGPAGAVAATVVARGGARVLLLDRARFPREKLCGDTINPGTVALLRRLRLDAALDAPAIPVDGMVVSGEHG